MVLLEQLEKNRNNILACIEGLDEQALTGEEVLPGWTAREIFTHIIAWGEELRANIRDILKGQHPGFDHQISTQHHFAAWNAEQITARKGWTWAQVMTEFERDHEEMTALLSSLKPADLRKRGVTPWKEAAFRKPVEPLKSDTESIEMLIRYHSGHMREHIPQLKQWRLRREK
jgi:hypothetical protein